jgi:subtilisin family serine protease
VFAAARPTAAPPTPPRPLRRPRLVALTSAALAVGLLTGTPSGASAAKPTLPADAVSAAALAALKGEVTAAPATGPLKAGRYIVTLREPAAATYTGGLAGHAATAPKHGQSLRTASADVSGYRSFLRSRQSSVAASVKAKMTSSYTLATNGFATKLSADQANTLRADPAVAAVVKDELAHPLDGTPSTDYLGLSGDTGVWAGNGGVAKAGEGVVVGVIDTGIAPENASFAGEPLGTTPGTEPYRDGDTIKFAKSDGGTFTGVCTTGEQFTADDCSTKIIGARYFADSFGTIGTPAVGEYRSPRDGASHGSHTASTAAGDNDVAASIDGHSLGRISGVTPAAKIAVYKVCWSGPSAGEEDDGCATGDLLAAIDAAVADNVDVINYSIGNSGGAGDTLSLTDMAFGNAAAAGIFVAAAGGNSGPDESTVDNAAPWITTAAASTIPTWDATVELGDGSKALGASVTLPTSGSPVSGSFVTAKSVGAAGAENPQLCGPNTLDPSKVAKAIVLCDRGTVDRVAKSAEVARAGGAGMVLVNPTANSVDLDTHSVPTIHVDAASYDLLSSYAATAAATATLTTGNSTGHPAAPSPQVAGFSSRGPLLTDGSDLIKPDVAAPGVAILAAAANAEGESGNYEFMSGTSMASPHIAGLGALYLGVHPNATPAEIKSALMTTTAPTVDGSGAASTDVFAQGNGQVQPPRYLNPGLLYLNGLSDWQNYLDAAEGGSTATDPSDLNLASVSIGALAGTQTVTRTVTATAAGTFTVDAAEIPGITTVVSPATLTFGAAGESHSYTITFTRTTADLDTFTTGYLTWRNGDLAVRSALAVRPVSLAVAAELHAQGSTNSLPVSLLGGQESDIAVTTLGLALGETQSGSGRTGDPAASFLVRIPDDTPLTRFTLDSAVDTADLDLSVYRLNDFGPSLVAESATGSADEQVDLDSPQAGTYRVDVTFYATAGAVDFDLTTFVLAAKGGLGKLKSTPATVHTTVGQTVEPVLSWAGLPAGSTYLGRVTWGDTGRTSILTVTGDALTGPPTDPGKPLLTVEPGFVLPGQSALVNGTGLKPLTAYSVFLDGSTTALITGRTSNTGSFYRAATIPTGTAVGAHKLVVRVAGQSATGGFSVTAMTLGTAEKYERGGFDGTPVAGIGTLVSGTGTIEVVIASATTGQEYLHSTRAVTTAAGRSLSFDSDRVRTTKGRLTATIAVLDSRKKATQKQTITWTPATYPANSATFTKKAGSVDLKIVNKQEDLVQPALRYKLTNGSAIYSMLYANPLETTTATHDLRGVDHVDLVLDGQTITTYTNKDANRTSGTPTILEDFWGTLSATPKTGDATKPLTLTISNRYAAYSEGYDLSVGVGPKIYDADPFYYEQVPHDLVTVKGPVIEKVVAVPAATRLWSTAYFEAHTPVFQYLGLRTLLIGATTAADLAPVKAPPLPAERFTVTATPNLAAKGQTVQVHATGLAAKERYTIKLADTVVTGTASSTGTVTGSVKIGAEPDRYLALVTGSRAARLGAAPVLIVPTTQKLTLGVRTVHPGQVEITVSRLAAHEPVQVFWREDRISPSGAHATTAGTYTIRTAAGSRTSQAVAKAVGVTTTRTGTLTVSVR